LRDLKQDTETYTADYNKIKEGRKSLFNLK